MGMAGSSFMDGVFEEWNHVHVNQTTNEVLVPFNPAPGFYVAVLYPLTTGRDGISENTYVFKAGGFAVYGESSLTIVTGTGAIYNAAGKSDYWGINVSYTDESKSQVRCQCGGGRVYFPSNHDLYILKVKDA